MINRVKGIVTVGISELQKLEELNLALILLLYHYDMLISLFHSNEVYLVKMKQMSPT